METKTLSYVFVSEEAENIVALGRSKHRRFKILPEFSGVIVRPVFNSSGTWLYLPKREEDDAIIPKEAFRRHQLVENHGYKTQQVIIGHELTVAPEKPAETKRKESISSNQKLAIASITAILGTGLLATIVSIAATAAATVAVAAPSISTAALVGLGAMALIDPSYVVVLADGTWIELLSWHTEVKNG